MTTVTGDDVVPALVSDTSTISDFGGGSSGNGGGAAPADVVIPTPPSPSHGEAAQPEGTCNMATQTQPYFSFSAKTCLEVLPNLNNDQLVHEMLHYKLLGYEMGFRTTRSVAANKLTKFQSANIVREIGQLLSAQCSNDMTMSLNHLHQLTYSPALGLNPSGRCPFDLL